MKKVAVIAAHPDDEALGCGATMARHAAQGDEVHVLFMTDGVGSRSVKPPDGAAERRSGLKQAMRDLGVASWRSLDLPDNSMDTVPLLKIVQAVEAIIQEVSPSIVYTHFFGDLNVDHRIVCEAVMTACRPQPGLPVREILCFEVLSSTDWAGPARPGFTPTVFIDVAAHWQAKLRALEAYACEMRPAPHARSMEAVEALSRYRGASVGLARAEAFVSLRRVVAD